LSYLRTDREYRKERTKIIDSVEREYADNVRRYNPWGKPGGGAPAAQSVRRTKEMELKERTNHPSRYELDGIVDRGSREVVGEGFDFYSNFGKPGGGAPVGNQTKRTLMLNERFDTKMKDHHWIHTGPPQFGVQEKPQMSNETIPGHSVLPNKPAGLTNETVCGPSISPKSPGNAAEVVDILFPNDNSSSQTIKGSPSNPKKIALPRYSKEKIPPWDKQYPTTLG